MRAAMMLLLFLLRDRKQWHVRLDIVRDKQLLGALDSQNRDVPRYTDIISKIPVLVQAGHTAYPG